MQQRSSPQVRTGAPFVVAKVPRGFYETRQRIRAAYEIREKVLQQQEAWLSDTTRGRASCSLTHGALKVVRPFFMWIREKFRSGPHGQDRTDGPVPGRFCSPALSPKSFGIQALTDAHSSSLQGVRCSCRSTGRNPRQQACLVGKFG